MDFFKNKKARFGMISLMLVFVEIVMFVIFLPAINSLIATAIPFLEGNVMGQWILALIPLAIIIRMTMGVFDKDDQFA